jgi:hypothetical protein
MAPILQGTGTFRAVRTKGVVRVVWVTRAFALLACAGADAKSPARCGPTDRPETGLHHCRILAGHGAR